MKLKSMSITKFRIGDLGDNVAFMSKFLSVEFAAKYNEDPYVREAFW